MKGLKRFSEFKNWFLDFFLSVFLVFFNVCFSSAQVIYGPDWGLLRRHRKRLQRKLKTLWHLQRKMTPSCRGFGVLSLRKKNSPGKKRVAWIIYPPYKSRSAGKAALARTLNHDWVHSLALQVWLQRGRIPFAQQLDTGKDSAVKVPQVSLFLFYKKRGINHLKPKAMTFVWSLWLALCCVGRCPLCSWQQTCSEL